MSKPVDNAPGDQSFSSKKADQSAKLIMAADVAASAASSLAMMPQNVDLAQAIAIGTLAALEVDKGR